MNKRNSQIDVKGSSHQAAQNDYLQKLADQLMVKPHQKSGAFDISGSTAPASEQCELRGGFAHRPNSQMTSICNLDNSLTPVIKFADDAQIIKILKNKQKLVAFREMIIMHIKKNDLSTKIISEDFEKMTNDIILPLNSFKQCLQVIGIHLNPQVSILNLFLIYFKQQLSKFAVKGEIMMKNK